MATAAERTDAYVREYLVYRGFTSALKQLENDARNGKDRAFRVDKVIDQLLHSVQSFDLTGLREYWSYLDRRLFSRLEDVYKSTVNKLRTSLYRYYLVNTIQKGNSEKTAEFFHKMAAELQGQAEWRDWFVLPFISAPELNPSFSAYFSRQWADTFLVSLHNFLSVLFQCMPQPALLSFDTEVQRTTALMEENEQLRQLLFALQGASRDQRGGEEGEHEEEAGRGSVHHKLPAYVQNMDRLGDSELDLVSSQRVSGSAGGAPSRNFFSTLLPQARRTPAKAIATATAATATTGTSSSPSRKEPLTNQAGKSKETAALVKEAAKSSSNQASSGETVALPTHHRHKRHQDHEKERKELFSKPPTQTAERKVEAGEAEAPPTASEGPGDAFDSASSGSSSNHTRSVGGGGGGGEEEQPFIKLSQEEYGEHHSSIMHCRVDCSGRRVASLDVDGVIKVWSFNPVLQTKATIMSKSALLSLEWAAKPDRLLLLGSGVGTVRLYDTDAKKNLYEMSMDESYPRILSLACSPSGSSFVCSAAAARPDTLPSAPETQSPAGQLLLWDTKTVKQQLQFCLEPEPVAINCTAFNHNGNLLVTGAADGVIRLFDMQCYQSAMSWTAHDGEVHAVEFSRDENAVFSVGQDGKFIQWNIHRCGIKQSEQALSQHATGPFVMSGYSGYKQVQAPRGRLFAFDSEGKHILTCSGNGGVIYRLTNSEPALEGVLALGGHKAPVVTVDWSSAVDCGTCLTASMDGKIKLSTLLAQKP
ncbi:WD repeat-containing protein 91 isoform 1-T3 [Polymixia lowei]